MAVVAHAEEYEVEARPLRIAEEAAHDRLVVARVRRGVAQALYAVDILRRDGYAREQSLARHAVVALSVVGRDGALVAEEDVNALPRNGGVKLFAREKLVDAARRRASRERDGEGAALFDCFTRESCESLGSHACDSFRVVEDSDAVRLFRVARRAHM